MSIFISLSFPDSLLLCAGESYFISLFLIDTQDILPLVPNSDLKNYTVNKEMRQEQNTNELVALVSYSSKRKKRQGNES